MHPFNTTPQFEALTETLEVRRGLGTRDKNPLLPGPVADTVFEKDLSETFAAIKRAYYTLRPKSNDNRPGYGSMKYEIAEDLVAFINVLYEKQASLVEVLSI